MTRFLQAYFHNLETMGGEEKPKFKAALPPGLLDLFPMSSGPETLASSEVSSSKYDAPRDRSIRAPGSQIISVASRAVSLHGDSGTLGTATESLLETDASGFPTSPHVPTNDPEWESTQKIMPAVPDLTPLAPLYAFARAFPNAPRPAVASASRGSEAALLASSTSPAHRLLRFRMSLPLSPEKSELLDSASLLSFIGRRVAVSSELSHRYGVHSLPTVGDHRVLVVGRPPSREEGNPRPDVLLPGQQGERYLIFLAPAYPGMPFEDSRAEVLVSQKKGGKKGAGASAGAKAAKVEEEDTYRSEPKPDKGSAERTVERLRFVDVFILVTREGSEWYHPTESTAQDTTVEALQESKAGALPLDSSAVASDLLPRAAGDWSTNTAANRAMRRRLEKDLTNAARKLLRDEGPMPRDQLQARAREVVRAAQQSNRALWEKQVQWGGVRVSWWIRL